MATRTFTLNNNLPGARLPATSTSVGWTGLLNGDDGTPYDQIAAADSATVQVTGTFGTGGSVTLEASDDGSSFAALPTPIAITAAGLYVVATTAHRRIRPRVTAGDGTTSLVVTLTTRTGYAV